MTMNRRTLLTTISAGLASGLAAPWVRPAHAAAGTLTIYNWSDYIGESTIEDFQSETGINVTYDLYASAEEMQARMAAGATGYDLVVQSGMALPGMLNSGIYRKIDRTRLKNLDQLDPAILKIAAGYDPGNAYGLPYLWGSVGFIYNADLVQKTLPGAEFAPLAAVFAPDSAARLAGAGISLLDSASDMSFMVLAMLGIDPLQAAAADYDRMAQAFAMVRPYIRGFDNSDYLNSLPEGRLAVAAAWSGDFSVAQAAVDELQKAGSSALPRATLAYAVPKTGAPAWTDLWCVPSEAHEVENAHIFMDYMLRPEVIAKCTDFTGYANGNRAATALIDPAIAANPAIYPDAATLSRLRAAPALSREQSAALARVWSQIKAG